MEKYIEIQSIVSDYFLTPDQIRTVEIATEVINTAIDAMIKANEAMKALQFECKKAEENNNEKGA